MRVIPPLRSGRLASAFRAAVRAAFPHWCVACGEEGSVLCPACRAAVQAPSRGLFVCPGCGRPCAAGGRCGRRACRSGPLDGLTAAGRYARRPFPELLRLWKYERVAEAGGALVGLFDAFVVAHREAFAATGRDAVIVPVPIHRVREAARGFNQSAILAAALGRAVGRPLSERTLVRAFRWSPQAVIEDAAARRKNAEGSVRLRPGARVPPRVLLVDDVVTSGATLDACAAALKRAGCREVQAVALLKG